jgi:hypothetical protein
VQPGELAGDSPGLQPSQAVDGCLAGGSGVGSVYVGDRGSEAGEVVGHLAEMPTGDDMRCALAVSFGWRGSAVQGQPHELLLGLAVCGPRLLERCAGGIHGRTDAAVDGSVRIYSNRAARIGTK